MMMKIFVNILFFTFLFSYGYGQIIPDSTGRSRADTIPGLPKETIPVFADTIHYNDTSVIKTALGKDSIVVKKKVHSPRTATIRSLIIPGWGQIYNKKYWKVPIVYGAIGFPAYLFTYNRKWYNRTKYALSIVANDRFTGADAEDSLSKVHPDLLFLVNSRNLGSLVTYKNQFRRDMDYAILFTILMWGLNIVDATVDGHLKGFDVGDELSMKIKPTLMQHSMTPGIALVVNFKK
jgi:hypothetical protein